MTMIADLGSYLKDKIEYASIFSSQPPIFILPTHLSLEELDEIEGRLIDYGGRLTYDIAEAGLVLGKVERAKRAALELRTRGTWTEELVPSSASKSIGVEPSSKRRRTDQYDGTKDVPVEIIDLSTESEGESGATNRHGPSKNPIPEPKVEEIKNSVTVLKLEWMDTSIKSGKCVSQDPFVVYRGRKIPSPPPTTKTENKQNLLQNPNQIIERAKQDAGLPTPRAPPPDYIHARRSKEPPDGSSPRPRPTLYRQTTSEHEKEENNALPQPDWVRDHVVFACLRSAPLHPPNEDFISQLVKIRRIRELTLDEIGVRAYSTSIASVAAYPYRIQRPSEILALPGCNAKIADLFAEFNKHGGCEHTDDDGNVAAADALETDPMLRVLNLLYGIWGVGAKTAREFYQRGWRDLDDIVENGWNTLSRVQQIGVKFYEEFQDGVPRGESEDIANIVRGHAGRVRPEDKDGIECVIVGGYRRGKELSGDVDIVLSHRDDAVTRNLVVDVVASLEAERYITHTLSLHLTSSLREQQTLPFHGDDTRKFDTLDKALVVWQDPHFDATAVGDDRPGKNPNIHRRVDIIISPWRTVGCAILGWSGDTTFQRDLRRYAKKARSLKFDSSGVRDRGTGRQVDLEHGGETWEEREKLVMEGLGIGWRPPEERCSR
ncbi:DNA polymerase family X [Penicillium robsamsonii]|uniref:DNA polymerase family X n=1 Tax=Penicillium robsamsonii TaxID=1792511 RepID=UPI0025478359|nr:DNA polymerase family X [Penicillium robsamsonii]KAJ5824588.1 DNA polymerase family X [Penicillium robsamsonii]